MNLPMFSIWNRKYMHGEVAGDTFSIHDNRNAMCAKKLPGII